LVGKEEGLRLGSFKTGFERPEMCFQCGRCTSSCTISKIVGDYRPNRIVGFVRHGLPERVLDEIVWKCAKCMKCVEYCPQKVAPADLIVNLQSQAVSRGSAFPEAYEEMLRNLSETGLAFRQVDVTDRDFELCNRASMGLPPLTAGAKGRVREIISRICKGEM